MVELFAGIGIIFCVAYILYRMTSSTSEKDNKKAIENSTSRIFLIIAVSLYSASFFAFLFLLFSVISSDSAVFGTGIVLFILLLPAIFLGPICSALFKKSIPESYNKPLGRVFRALFFFPLFLFVSVLLYHPVVVPIISKILPTSFFVGDQYDTTFSVALLLPAFLASIAVALKK